MTAPVPIADVAAYLQENGWRPTPDSWRGARIWARDGVEVLVPTREDLGDNPARIRDVYRAVAVVESRTVTAVARDIDRPLLDVTTCRPEAGFSSLPHGLLILTGLRDTIANAARALLEGPHLRFSRVAPPAVEELVSRVRLAPPAGDEAGFAALVPVGSKDGLPGRDVVVQLYDAAAAVEEAARADDVTAFDDTVTAGVSAEFCAALSWLAGPEYRAPFELEFRWAYRLRSDVPARTVSFRPDAGRLLRDASRRLRRLEVSGPATVTGRVDGLHDEAGGADRWRVRVRGELRLGRPVGTRRVIWVRLPDQSAYDGALEAYRVGLRVRAEGVLTSRDGRVELTSPSEGIDIVDDRGPEDDRAR